MMRLHVLLVGIFFFTVGCAGAPPIREAAVVPVLAGQLRIGGPAMPPDSTPPASTQRDIIVCVMDARHPCPREFRRLYFTRGTPDPIDLIRADVWDSTVATLALRFRDSTSIATAATWIEQWLGRRPWTRTATVMEWMDGKYGVHLEAGDGSRPVALVYRLSDGVVRYPPLSSGDWWKLCTELSVNFCTR